MSLNEDDKKEQMMAEAMLIINSVAFLESQMHKVLGELQEAINNHYVEDADKIEAQIRFLIKKTNDENHHMDEFMNRYKDKINEKKAILSNLEQKKQIHNGRVPAFQRRPKSGSPVQRLPQEAEQGYAVDN